MMSIFPTLNREKNTELPELHIPNRTLFSIDQILVLKIEVQVLYSGNS